jgi:hypothetical protein
LKRGIIDNRSIDNLSDRLSRIEAAEAVTTENELEESSFSNSDEDSFEEFAFRFYKLPGYARSKILDKMSKEEQDRLYEFLFNWECKTMTYYKQEVMRYHNISSDEYDRRTLEGDQSIYLPQPNRRFEPTHYDLRVAHVLGLDYRGLQQKFRQGELEHRIATGIMGFRDEDPNAVF